MDRILIIQDSVSINALLKNLLESGGLTAETAETGGGGIKKASVGGYKLIILDYKLPDIDGKDVCRILRKKEITKDTPIVFLSTIDEEEISKISKDAGANGYIRIPFKGKELVKKIKGYIKHN